MGTYPLRPENRVRPLVDGEPAFRRIGEAVGAARRSVWVTVAFVERDCELPDGQGTLFDVLDRAAARGLDVRALFWREPELAPAPGWHHFRGSEEERAWLRARGARFRARWDHLPRYCHHQKSWLVDAGEAGEVAFVGGINLDRASIAAPGHCAQRDTIHDVYLELAGPAATDVHHNFVQRWNEASERARPDGVWPDRAAADDLPFPDRLSPSQGEVAVQVTRTVRAGRYAAAVAAPGAAPFAIAGGEQSVLEQYTAAIDGAVEGIYLEQQFFASSEVFTRLEAALRRGVAVTAVVPRTPIADVRAARRDPRAAHLFAQLAALGRFERFTLAGLATDGRDVYVHAKVAIVDDAWATIGSANVIARSFHADTELNASVWDGRTVSALRRRLLLEHTGVDTAGLGVRAALAAFRETAHANRDRVARGEPLDGLAVALDPARYAA
jgi:phosphatidylserine/phosphatidylglycerophosphate/cardiolipin synthase-like enzyme